MTLAVGVYHSQMARRPHTHQRVTITPPAETVRLLDSVAPKSDRNRFSDQPVTEQVKRVGKANFREELKEGYLRENKINRQLAEEWFSLGEESWETREEC